MKNNSILFYSITLQVTKFKYIGFTLPKKWTSGPTHERGVQKDKHSSRTDMEHRAKEIQEQL